MHSNYPCSLWYLLECCCYCTFFEVQYFVIAIVVWTCLTVFFLGICSKYYVVTSCICSCFVCYFDSRSAYFNVCDNWSVRCDCGYNEWICVRPVAEYFQLNEFLNSTLQEWNLVFHLSITKVTRMRRAVIQLYQRDTIESSILSTKFFYCLIMYSCHRRRILSSKVCSDRCCNLF